jgi:GTP-binding protein LepA
VLVRSKDTVTGSGGQALKPVDLRTLEGGTPDTSTSSTTGGSGSGGAGVPPASSSSSGGAGVPSAPLTPTAAAAAAAAAETALRKKHNIPEGFQLLEVHNPADLPDMGHIEEIREPVCRVEIMTPKEYIGDIMKLCLDRRGLYKAQTFVSKSREMVTFEIPLAEIIYDFFDKMKGLTSGYGTMDYEVIGYRADNLVKLDILINGDPVEALSLITHRDKAEGRGRLLLTRLRKQIDRHQFEIPLQAAIGGKIIARETIKAYRKDVTAKCYGGDVSRKRKLLEKQKKGKEKMKNIGSVNIPQKAFMAVLETGE